MNAAQDVAATIYATLGVTVAIVGAFVVLMVLIGYPIVAIIGCRALVRIARALESAPPAAAPLPASRLVEPRTFAPQPRPSAGVESAPARPGDLGLSR